MNWRELTEPDQIDQIVEESKNSPVLIFKHSRSCSISRTSLDRLERNWNVEEAKTYFLDLLSHRATSNAIAERFGITHESPQVLVIEQGECVYDRSHFDINYPEIKDKMQVAAK